MKKLSTLAILAITMVVLVLVFIGKSVVDLNTTATLDPDRFADRGPKKTASPNKMILAATASPTPEISKLSFVEIEQNYSSMTEAQFKEYKNGINGSLVKWTGTVEEVQTKTLGTYAVRVCDSYLCSNDITLLYKNENALKLNKGQKITFTGNVFDVSTFLGMTVYLNNVELIE